MRYVPKQMFEEWEARDPIRRYEERLGTERIAVEPIRASVMDELERETEWALEQPMPDSATATEGVFADGDPELGDGEAPWSRWSGEEAGGG
jgi:TPP-dependent pyruvate/acetoin dehydrogenase alpha subunit